MNYNTSVGQFGEDVACAYLKNKAYKIIERNHKQKWGEIDIIARDPANTLVFVEVKTMRQNNPAIAELKPEDNLTAAKLKKLQRTAALYAGFNEKIIGDVGWRIDLIAICFTLNKYIVKHYENI